MSVWVASACKMVGDISRELGKTVSFMSNGDRTRVAPRCGAFLALSNVRGFCIAPSVPAPILGFRTKAATSFLNRSTTVSNGMFSLSAVVIPPWGMNRFCGAVHICPEYRETENARFRMVSRGSRTESMMTELTPAFSVKVILLGRDSIYSPKVLPPV